MSFFFKIGQSSLWKGFILKEIKNNQLITIARNIFEKYENSSTPQVISQVIFFTKWAKLQSQGHMLKTVDTYRKDLSLEIPSENIKALALNFLNEKKI